MPRLDNRLPNYSLHKLSGQAKVRYGGKDKYLGKYGTQESKDPYARFIASIPKPSNQAVRSDHRLRSCRTRSLCRGAQSGRNQTLRDARRMEVMP
jgi:hypothetical protein